MVGRFGLSLNTRLAHYKHPSDAVSYQQDHAPPRRNSFMFYIKVRLCKPQGFDVNIIKELMTKNYFLVENLKTGKIIFSRGHHSKTFIDINVWSSAFEKSDLFL